VFADILAKLTVEDQRAYARSMIDTKKIESLHTLLEYLAEEAKIMVSSQSDQRSSKIGIYPVNVDGGYNGAPGCGLGCSQQHGLGYCPAFKKMKVKEKWEVVIQSKRCKNVCELDTDTNSVRERHVISTVVEDHIITYCIKMQNKYMY
jgi:hypothetical protein